MFKVHSVGHPLKRGGTKGVRGHTLNQTYETPGRGGGVRKTYKKIIIIIVWVEIHQMLYLSGIIFTKFETSGLALNPTTYPLIHF